MTVCIAARCRTADKKHAIVTISDMKLSTGSYSGEMATLKVRHISRQWKCLIAGTFAHHVPLIDHISNAVGPWNTVISHEDIKQKCTNAFIAENKRLVEETILSPFGLTLETFLKSRKELGESLYERTWAEIVRVKVDCQMIVCGFSPNPHIFTVENPTSDRPGFITDCDFPGFAAIGSGAYLADSTLFALQQNPVRSLAETIYLLSAAKFAAEAASDVGKESYFALYTQEGDPKVVIDNVASLVNDIREVWEEKGKPTIPPQALDVINKHITSGTELLGKGAEG